MRLDKRLACLVGVMFFPLHVVFPQFIVPGNQFTNVDELGHIKYWKKIGELKLNEGEIPVNVGFSPDRESKAAMLGYGWILPVLESFIYQTDNDMFVNVGLDGTERVFIRDKKVPDKLVTADGSTANIEGNRIAVTDPSKFTTFYVDGHIVSFATAGGEKFLVKNKNGRRGVYVDGTDQEIFGFTPPARDGERGTLQIGEKAFAIEFAPRPRVAVVNGARLVDRVQPSLSKIGENYFEYGVDEKLDPSFSIDGEKLVWDPVSKVIMEDALWRYTVSGDRSISRVERAKKAGSETEELFHDRVKGEWKFSSSDEGSVLLRYFRSGSLSGKLRYSERASPEGVVTKTKFKFNENGDIMAEVVDRNGVVSEKRYTFDGAKLSRVEVFEAGKLIFESDTAKPLNRHFERFDLSLSEARDAVTLKADSGETFVFPLGATTKKNK